MLHHQAWNNWLGKLEAISLTPFLNEVWWLTLGILYTKKFLNKSLLHYSHRICLQFKHARMFRVTLVFYCVRYNLCKMLYIMFVMLKNNYFWYDSSLTSVGKIRWGNVCNCCFNYRLKLSITKKLETIMKAQL